MSKWWTIKIHHAVPVLTFASFCVVWSRSLSRSLHRCTPSNPSTISPIEILSSDLLVEWNEFSQYWRRCVELCDWIFQAILLISTVRWAWIHNGYKTKWAPWPAVGVIKRESTSFSSLLTFTCFLRAFFESKDRTETNGDVKNLDPHRITFDDGLLLIAQPPHLSTSLTTLPKSYGLWWVRLLFQTWVNL
jgi:hypothetical protein